MHWIWVFIFFRNSNIQERKNVQSVAKEVPLNRILIETDSPYLTPVPLRGKPNKPENVRFVAEYLAHLKGVSFDEVCYQTSSNFNRLFKL